jgi:uncharacterized protein (TIGR02996 family)
MSDEQGLLTAICDSPEDDVPRLIYADWLDEHGTTKASRARAEFIRLQCESAQLSPEDVDVDAAQRRTRLELRADDLLRTSGGESLWRVPLSPMPSPFTFPRMTAGRFVRGFPPFALASPDEFVTLGEGLFRVSPLHILWSGVASEHQLTAERADRLLAAPWLRQVRRMEVSVTGDVAEQLFRSENLAGLEKLTIHRANLQPADSPVTVMALVHLRELSLWDLPERGPAVVGRLAKLLSASQLTGLELKLGWPAPVDTVRELTTLEPFRGLERLGLAGPDYAQPLTGAALRHLTAAAFWRNLRYLGIVNWGLGDEAAEALAEAPPAPHLRKLRLGVHSLTLQGIAALTRSPLLRSVTALDLAAGNGVGDEGAALLAQSPYLENLVDLDLAVGRLGPKGVKALAGARWASNLVRLNLRDNAIRKTGVELLADPKRFPRLLRVDLQRAVRTADLKAVLVARFGSGVRFMF